jgi:hypothetical protein
VKPAGVPTPRAGGLRVYTPWKDHGVVRSHRNLKTGARNLKWISNGAKAGTLEPGAGGRWDVYDEDDVYLGTVESEEDGMDLVASRRDSGTA